MRKSVRDPLLVSTLRRLAIIFLSGVTIIGFAACGGQTVSSGVVQFAIDTAPADSAITIRDLRFYIHDIDLLDQNGGAHPFVLVREERWQGERVALVDLVGTSPHDRHAALRGHAPAVTGGFVGIRFTVGVPFDLNHADVLKASAPLNKGDLFWSWQSGYKFLRVDLSEGGKEWSFHLGSTGCASASALRAPQAPCSQPNTIRVELQGMNPLNESISVRVGKLIEAMRAPDSGTCTGGYVHDPACALAFSLTGLNPHTGSCEKTTCPDQQLFATSQ